MRRAVATLGLCLLAAAPAAAAARDPDVALGREVARRTCAACHAVEPAQAGPIGRAPPFASREMRHVAGLEGRLAALTRAGHYGMPPQPLSEREIKGLLAYIEALGAAARD